MKTIETLCVLSALTLRARRNPEPTAAAPVARADVAPSSTAYVQVEESSSTTCSLPNDEERAPKFDYDEATLRPRGEGILDGVAACLTDGPMKGETVTVIGHADPRGSDEYNQKLGEKRARAASGYLTAHSVDASRIRIDSRGEEAATGQDEASWKRDRRVEVRRGSVAP